MKKINETIRDFREDNDLSQLEISKHLGISRFTYARYESVNSKISIDIIVELSKCYKTTPNVILGYTNSFSNIDISKLDKLYKFIIENNINIDKLIKLIELSKNINNLLLFLFN